MAEAIFKITPQIRELADICTARDKIDTSLYTHYDVKRGLRDLNGKGVRAGLTNISEVNAKKIVNGEEVEQNVTMAPPVIAAEDAADYYLPDQSDDFMPVFTDADNTWNISLEDILE